MRQGRLQRFCQQCGRCHELSEFEGNQRSCRAQLDRHNARYRIGQTLYMCTLCSPVICIWKLYVTCGIHCMYVHIGQDGLSWLRCYTDLAAGLGLQLTSDMACRRRQAKKNAQAAKSGAAGLSNAISAASQPLSSAHAAASASREQARAYSADLEQYQRFRAKPCLQQKQLPCLLRYAFHVISLKHDVSQT